MITNILIAIICMVAFFTSIWCYRRGLKDGLSLKNDNRIEPIKSPVSVIKEVAEAKEIKEAEQTEAQFMTNLFGYDGTKQEKVDNK